MPCSCSPHGRESQGCFTVIGRQRVQAGTLHGCQHSSEPHRAQVSPWACFPEGKLEQFSYRSEPCKHTSQSHQQQKSMTISADSQPDAPDPSLLALWMLSVTHEKISEYGKRPLCYFLYWKPTASFGIKKNWLLPPRCPTSFFFSVYGLFLSPPWVKRTLFLCT